MRSSDKKKKLTYYDPESKYAEFDDNGVCFYISPFDPRFAYSLDEPELMAEIAQIDFEQRVVYIKRRIRL